MSRIVKKILITGSTQGNGKLKVKIKWKNFY